MSREHKQSESDWSTGTVLWLILMATSTVVVVFASHVGSSVHHASEFAIIRFSFWSMIVGTITAIVGGIGFTLSRRGAVLWALLAIFPIVGPFYIAYRFWPGRWPPPGHCPACNYDLRGSKESATCPECGEAITEKSVGGAEG